MQTRQIWTWTYFFLTMVKEASAISQLTRFKKFIAVTVCSDALACLLLQNFLFNRIRYIVTGKKEKSLEQKSLKGYEDTNLTSVTSLKKRSLP